MRKRGRRTRADASIRGTRRHAGHVCTYTHVYAPGCARARTPRERSGYERERARYGVCDRD